MVSAAPFLRKEWERDASPAALCRRRDRSLKFWCRGRPMRSDRPPSRRHGPRSSGKQGRSRKCDVFPRCGVKGQESCCLRSPQIPWRQSGVRIRHMRGSMVVWHASAITGASADTMEEENLKPGWRRLGGAFSIPPTSGLFFSRRRPQQSAVAALHQSESGLDQADDLIPQFVRWPFPLGNTLGG